jgi:hypothetical protein
MRVYAMGTEQGVSEILTPYRSTATQCSACGPTLCELGINDRHLMLEVSERLLGYPTCEGLSASLLIRFGPAAARTQPVRLGEGHRFGVCRCPGYPCGGQISCSVQRELDETGLVWLMAYQE